MSNVDKALQKRRRKSASLTTLREKLASHVAKLQDMITYAESGELARQLPTTGELDALADSALKNIRKEAASATAQIADLDHRIAELGRIMGALRTLRTM